MAKRPPATNPTTSNNVATLSVWAALQDPSASAYSIIEIITSRICGIERRYVKKARNDGNPFGEAIDIFDGCTPLLLAVLANRADVIQQLIAHQANTKACNALGDTVLHLAVKSNYLNLLQSLLSTRHYDLEVKNKEEHTPLQIALLKKKQDMVKPDIVKLFLTYKIPNSLLPFAAGLDEYDLVRSLLSKGFSANATTFDSDESIPLYRALQNKRSKIALLLLERGAEVDSTFEDKKKPLHIACEHGMGLVAKALVIRGASLNPIDAKGNTPLHYTRTYDNRTSPAVIDFLLGEGCLYCVPKEKKIGQKRARSPEVNANPQADKLLTDNPKSSLAALWMALAKITCNEEENVRYLTYGPEVAMAIVNHPRCGLEMRSCGQDEMMSIGEYGDNYECYFSGLTPLLMAIHAGRSDVVLALAEAGADVNVRMIDPLHPTRADGKSALYLAVDRDDIASINALLAHGADPSPRDWKGKTPMFNVRSAEAVNALVAKGAKATVRVSGCTPLHAVLEHKGCYVDTVEALLHHGARVETTDADGMSALHKSVKFFNIEITKLILSKGPFIDATDLKGNTPLHLAGLHCNKDVKDLLIEGGASLEAENDEGQTPLSHAIFNGYLECVEYLVAKGASLSAKDMKGNTPLHQAVLRARPDVVELLVSKGASLSATNVEGWTPLQALHKSTGTNSKKYPYHSKDIDRRIRTILGDETMSTEEEES